MINEERICSEFAELVQIDAPGFGERRMADDTKITRLLCICKTVGKITLYKHHRRNEYILIFERIQHVRLSVKT